MKIMVPIYNIITKPMNLTKFRDVYPAFLALLGEKGYTPSTIDKYRWIINRFLREACADDICSFEDYFIYLSGIMSQSSLPEIKTYLGALKIFVEDGVFYRDMANRTNFLRPCSYSNVNEYYKGLIDNCLASAATKYEDNTIRSIKTAASVFCLYFQEHGHKTFDTVCSIHDVIEYFFDGVSSLRNCAHRFYVGIFLSLNSDSDIACKRVLSYLPNVPDVRKNYDFLKPEEKVKIENCLLSNSLTLRDKAIGIIAYYTGLRKSDIVNLKLDDVDLDRNLILIDSQEKTDVPLTLPLRPIVRDAICDYVEHERPTINEEHIFITETRPYKKMCAGSLAHVAIKIMDAAGVRTDGGRRGLHMFRHAFASDLVSMDVPRETVTALLGQTSFSSIDSYIDSDIENLRSCALSIESYKDGSTDKAIMSSYKSRSADLLSDITKKLDSRRSHYPLIHRTLCLLDEFCLSSYPSSPLTQDILDQWSRPFNDEMNFQYMKRMKYIEEINAVMSDYGLALTLYDAPPSRVRKAYSKGFASKCNKLFEEYVEFQKASQHWCGSYDYSLKSFDAYCCEHNSDVLPSQDDIYGWSTQKDSESLSSCGKRVAFLAGLCRYSNTFYGTQLLAPNISTKGETMFAPHAFNDVELRNFFIACDNVEREHKSKWTLIRQIVIPALFRLLFSSGMRTKEVRMLDCEDVDLKYGIVDIRRSKGLHEHRIALHPSMIEYLCEYDRLINAVIPDRKCFFPNIEDSYFTSSWLDWNFMQMWYRYNGSYAVPYDFRHNYAITNINSWPAECNAFNKHLVCLSRSMGHANIDETMYYYSYTPAMAQNIIDSKSNTFHNIITSNGFIQK